MIMSNDITTIQQFSVAEIAQMGRIITESGFYGYKKPEEAMALMLQAQADGVHPAKAAQEYHIINGRPSLKAQAMQSRFQMAGGKTKWIERTDKKCVLELSHPQGGELTVTWTIEKANAAGLTGNPTWKKFPASMLSARCISEGVRALFPACLGGLYTPEEEDDISFERRQNDPLPGHQEVKAEEPAQAPAKSGKKEFKDKLIALKEENAVAFKHLVNMLKAKGWEDSNKVPANEYKTVLSWWNECVQMAQIESIGTETEEVENG